MLHPRMNAGLALLLALSLLWATSLVQAGEEMYIPKSTNADPSVEAMLADGLLLRPAGVVATILGSLAFVVTLPFTVPTKSVHKAAQKMVVDPARYTFVRPFGHIDSPRPSQQ
ncbi:MAG: multidrug transporter [Candidatus Tectimicrobiota bacterium]